MTRQHSNHDTTSNPGSTDTGNGSSTDYRAHGPEDPDTHGIPTGDALETTLRNAHANADALARTIDTRTVNTFLDADSEEAFFTTETGASTVVTRYDLEKTVPGDAKTHFEEIDRYWVNKPYAFISIFHSTKEHEKKYYVIEPFLNEHEQVVKEFLRERLRETLRYAPRDAMDNTPQGRASTIHEFTNTHLENYEMIGTVGSWDRLVRAVTTHLPGLTPSPDPTTGTTTSNATGGEPDTQTSTGSGNGNGIYSTHPRRTTHTSVRPTPAVLREDQDTLHAAQIEKLLYYLKRDLVGFGAIDAIKHDINVEDISCDGYDIPVFAYHTEHEQLISNVTHDPDTLDDFVTKLAQRSGMGLSKREPQVDATLTDGSRAQLTLGTAVSDRGTNYTIRQFKDVPFTPIDLINWRTFSIDEMAFLWLAIENNQSIVFAGGTASGKTTSLNAVSLFIPSNSKIVSIEDTRELELPQQNWVASTTRSSFSGDDASDVDEFDLLEAALRQRPEYIVMGEIRGEEGRTLFQVMSTGHTSYTTFHADSVGEVIKRFTTDPINVSKTLFTALDLVSIQTSTRVDGDKVRRTKTITEVNDYDSTTDELRVSPVFEWDAETDTHEHTGATNTVQDIMEMRGWDRDRVDREIRVRKVVLAYLIQNGLNSYTNVAATIQGFLNDNDTILSLIANDELRSSLDGLQDIESVVINIPDEKEEMVPRPDAPGDVQSMVESVLSDARAPGGVLTEYIDTDGGADADVVDALAPTRTTSSSGQPTDSTAGDGPAGDVSEFHGLGDGTDLGVTGE